ncbi:hypothetical protein KAJ83_08530 [Marivibrio halodurans]|uniref:Phage holin family protein n=1 Tax=Marivibrio halodurans TaxID=2039722 RepID=A0A8J7V2L8_9PROT|nr:hypothetical protein [Marivibrio halodurans]MBP5857052.1 hypothetical protein [Marivibrio halodurans]
MADQQERRESTLAAMARGASTELLRGVDAGLDAAGDRLSARLDAAADRLLARGFVLLLSAVAVGWMSFAVFAAVSMVAPGWAAALVTAGALVLAAVLCRAVFLTRARSRDQESKKERS